LQSTWKDTGRTQLGPITELPEIDESSMTDNKSFSRGNSNAGRGGAGGSSGGYGANRNSGGSSRTNL
jgi:hypothetical protein